MTSPLGTRRNWASMSTTDRNTVIAGFQRAKSNGSYDRLTELHQRAMRGDGNEWHRGPRLLPAHRWFLIQLENAIGVPVPYWDWVTNRALPTGFGPNGTASAGYRMTSGPFATWNSRIYNSSTGQFTTRTGVIRQIATFASSLPTATQANAALAQTTYDASPWNTSARTGFRNWLEGGTGAPAPAMHNRVHEWVGGDMRAGTSPNDPIFWLHHAQVDRMWASWQRRRGTANYAAPSTMGPDVVMPLTGVTPRQMFPIPAYQSYLTVT